MGRFDRGSDVAAPSEVDHLRDELGRTRSRLAVIDAELENERRERWSMAAELVSERIRPATAPAPESSTPLEDALALEEARVELERERELSAALARNLEDAWDRIRQLSAGLERRRAPWRRLGIR